MSRRFGSSLVLAALISAFSLVACSAPSAPPPQPTAKPAAPAPTAASAAPTSAPAPAVPTSAPAAPTTAAAEKFPTRPIEIVVPAAAGGGQDIYTRIVAKYSEKTLGQAISIVNIAGTQGYTRIANAKPDGYALGSLPPTGVFQPLLIKDIQYTPKSFKWIIQHSFDPVFLAVKKGGPLDLAPDKFVEYVKAHPGEVKAATSLLWSQQDLACVSLSRAAGAEIVRVHFDSGTQGVTALLGDNVNVTFNYYTEILSQLKAGNVSIVGSLNDGKWELLPDVPSFKEKGYDVVFGNWRALTGPKDLPDSVVKQLHDAFKKALDMPEMQADMKAAGFPLVYRNSADTQKYIESEIDNRYGKLITDLGMKPQ